MAFRVELAPRAFADLDAIAGYITENGGSEQARRWFNGMMDAIASLKNMPNRCPVVTEPAELSQQVRLLLHGRRNRKYKVYFSVFPVTLTTGVVRVYHVKHWARRGLEADELGHIVEDASQ